MLQTKTPSPKQLTGNNFQNNITFFSGRPPSQASEESSHQFNPAVTFGTYE